MCLKDILAILVSTGDVIINNGVINSIGTLNANENSGNIQVGANNTNTNIPNNTELEKLAKKLIAEILKAQNRNAETDGAIETIKEIAKNPDKVSKFNLKTVCAGLNTILGTLSNAADVLPKLEAFIDYIML